MVSVLSCYLCCQCDTQGMTPVESTWVKLHFETNTAPVVPKILNAMVFVILKLIDLLARKIYRHTVLQVDSGGVGFMGLLGHPCSRPCRAGES